MNDVMVSKLQHFLYTYQESGDGIQMLEEEAYTIITNCLDKSSHALIRLYQVRKQPSKKERSALLAAAMDDILSAGLDTEDKELAYEWLHELSELVHIDARNLRPDSLGDSYKEFERSAKEYITWKQTSLQTVRTGCIECGQDFLLEVWEVNKAQSGGWFITECDSCHNFDYIRFPEHFEHYSMSGFTWKEFLNDMDFTRDNVVLRVEQLIAQGHHPPK